MGGAIKYFPKKLLGHEIFRLYDLLGYEIFYEKFVKPFWPPYVFNVRSLIWFIGKAFDLWISLWKDYLLKHIMLLNP